MNKHSSQKWLKKNLQNNLKLALDPQNSISLEFMNSIVKERKSFIYSILRKSDIFPVGVNLKSLEVSQN